MKEFLTSRDKRVMREDLESFRGSYSHGAPFYRVVETYMTPSGISFDPIFNEPVDAFARKTVARKYYAFDCSIISDNRNSEYSEAGFSTKRSIVLDVDRSYNWTVGEIVLHELSFYRLVDADVKGSDSTSRQLIRIEQVT